MSEAKDILENVEGLFRKLEKHFDLMIPCEKLIDPLAGFRRDNLDLEAFEVLQKELLNLGLLDQALNNYSSMFGLLIAKIAEYKGIVLTLKGQMSILNAQAELSIKSAEKDHAVSIAELSDTLKRADKLVKGWNELAEDLGSDVLELAQGRES